MLRPMDVAKHTAVFHIIELKDGLVSLYLTRKEYRDPSHPKNIANFTLLHKLAQ